MDRDYEHIDNKYGGCDIPFDGIVKKVDPPELQIENLRKAAGVLVDCFKSITETVSLLVKPMAKLCKSISNAVISAYPKKRVVYLALHGKPRVRKKNMRRIMKWLEVNNETSLDID